MFRSDGGVLMDDARPQLRVIAPEASTEEVAAIVAALTVSIARGDGPQDSGAPERSRWVTASRLAARRTGLSRGEWRLSGRIGRRARA